MILLGNDVGVFPLETRAAMTTKAGSAKSRAGCSVGHNQEKELRKRAGMSLKEGGESPQKGVTAKSKYALAVESLARKN